MDGLECTAITTHDVLQGSLRFAKAVEAKEVSFIKPLRSQDHIWRDWKLSLMDMRFKTEHEPSFKCF